MQPETTEPNERSEYSPDLFDEPRDHANQWDVSGIWFEEGEEPQDNLPRTVVR